MLPIKKILMISLLVTWMLPGSACLVDSNGMGGSGGSRYEYCVEVYPALLAAISECLTNPSSKDPTCMGEIFNFWLAYNDCEKLK